MRQKLHMTVSEIARRIGARIEGDSNRIVSGLASPAAASEEDVIVVFSRQSAPDCTDARVAVVARDHVLPGFDTLLRVEEPRVALAALSALFCPSPHGKPGQHPTACVSADADVHETASIGPMCVVEPGARIAAGTTLVASCYIGHDVRIGANCLLHPGVVLYSGTILGDRVVVHANSAVGQDGFSFVTEDPYHPKVHSLSHVIIEDDVEIGGGTSIHRGTLEPTRIGKGTKIDAHVIIAHNCRIGEYCLVVGKAGIAGSVSLGDRVVVAGDVTIRDHVTIGANSVIMMGSLVLRDTPPGSVFLGAPAQDHLAEKERYRALTALAAQDRVTPSTEDPA